ncbi:type IV pili methyl-accepting chemotaxis transducer N-terminal domain-containing protein [Flavivirga jejuensis]|uniref:Type IV pili methyl-accepting chemotaxis transducer N-terminal domain-containing protein n=1 Tax=Flavivirga jejuensis TaxID=870487 RepID=A0ABT8WI94_9FLAO|nr:type IV pili methyl-accepting chemotaxis transducer N-terminal domain-containing protein [Flavivirga jejuensis]MDO5972856.1 type IV pili methyl-accepting chemotaxis transducer N-terminal domain-containing protein [Flavivirga jejuensis]
MKSKITITLFMIILLTINNATAQTQNFGSINYNKAINISGKQRMLSQKMSKAYLLISKGVNNEKIKKELNSSKFIFDKQLEILNENAKSSSTKLYIKKVYGFWNEFKRIINKTASLDNSLRIMQLNTELLDACHKVVQSIEATSNYDNKFFENNDQELIKTINVSGKQRMLSQRLCLYFAAIKIFPKNKAEYRPILDSVFDEFSDVIGRLLISTYNDTETEEEIGLVMAVWEQYQSSKRKFLDGDFELIDVYNVTNDLTKSFNKITGLYELLSEGQK